MNRFEVQEYRLGAAEGRRVVEVDESGRFVAMVAADYQNPDLDALARWHTELRKKRVAS